MGTQTPTREGAVLLTPADAARLAKVSRDTIYREIDRGTLPPSTPAVSSSSIRTTSAAGWKGRMNVTKPAPDPDTVAADARRAADVNARFAAIAKDAQPNNERIIELARELHELLDQWRSLLAGAEQVNRDRWGSPRYARASMPNSQHVEEVRKWVRTMRSRRGRGSGLWMAAK
jgi:hypothetical protein